MLLEIAYGWLLLVLLVEAARLAKTRSFVRRVRAAAAAPRPAFAPPATVILPLKGLDYQLEQNIRALAAQEYKRYELLIVVDDRQDPACLVAQRVNSKRIAILKARAIPGCSGKVAALISAAPFARGEVLVFADSDMRVRKTWLRDLVAPLADPKIGATTGYRWYFPLRGFSSCLLSAWNALGVGVMFNQKHNFLWGGSFAITRQRFGEFGILEKWKGEISDDTVVGQAVKRAGLEVRFVPAAVSASFAHASFRELVRWTTRQISFIRLYARGTWRAALFWYSSFTVLLLGGVALLAAGAFRNELLLPGALVLLAQLAGPVRFRMVRQAFRGLLPEFEGHFSCSPPGCALAEILVAPLAAANLVKAKFLKEIEWRGRRYPLARSGRPAPADQRPKLGKKPASAPAGPGLPRGVR